MERTLLLGELQRRMGHTFTDITLLETALTHSSYAKGDGNSKTHNERLEYLGDAVLELIVSEQLYAYHPAWSEGELTRARSAVVCEKSLFELAKKKLSLQDYLLLGHGEELCGGRSKPSIVSDAMEAVIGAVFIDGGIDAAREFVYAIAGDCIKESGGKTRDYKTSLQEYVQRKQLGAVAYKLKSESGPDHEKVFVMQAIVKGEVVGEGIGASKQESSRNAAHAALDKLKKKE